MTRAIHTAALFALLFGAAGAVLAQEASPLDTRLKVKWQGSTLRFSEGGRNHEVSIEGQFDAAEIGSVKVQSAREAGGFIFLLLDVTGPSKLPKDSSQCGNGTEADLVWLKLDQAWKFKEGASFLYASCLLNIATADAPKWNGDTLTVATGSQVASYSNAHPEAGLKISAAGAAN